MLLRRVSGLYILSLGMGLPLLVLGSSGGKILPRPGAWMDLVKAIFGFLLLSVPLVLLPYSVVKDVLLELASLWWLVFAAFLSNKANNYSKTIGVRTWCRLFAIAMVLVAHGDGELSTLVGTNHCCCQPSCR
ncbi:MAG: hypothetical protein U5L01_02465 [Rheinheimera sp.]|nr:hypothetical protein [Rheinheimera sp.]